MRLTAECQPTKQHKEEDVIAYCCQGGFGFLSLVSFTVPAMLSGSLYALLAGFMGAAASLTAKLSFGAHYLSDMCEAGLSRTGSPGQTAVCDWLHIPLRLLCAGLLFTCNTVMWTFFSKALRHCSSSARATVTTTASNFISSVSSRGTLTFTSHLCFCFLHEFFFLCFQAVLGRLIFGETHAALWWVGISLTLCGLLVLHRSTPQALPQEEGKKDT
uniref:Transmembrane protein 42a n=1 Tax=Labrus bergylta TaxID=56723 RepID=A0A3Q3ELY5_9LABR